VYFIILGFFSSVYHLFNFGPKSYVDLSVYECTESWWRNMLFINNYRGDYPVSQFSLTFIKYQMSTYI